MRALAIAPGNLKMVSEEVSAGLTVIVLTHNRREQLRLCLESLFAQDDPGIPLYFIVVDDGSTDGTEAMVRELTASRAHWQTISQPPLGIAAARNSGIRNSRSAWIAIVADDYILPAHYARAIAAFFKDHPQAQVLRFKVVPSGGGFLNLALHAYQEASVIRRLAPHDSRARLPRFGQRANVEEMMTTDHDLEAAGAAAFRKEVFQRVGYFDESFVRGEDTEFTRRLRDAGIPVHYSPGVHIGHRNDSNLKSALKNVFNSGRASWRLYAAPAHKPASFPSIAMLALRFGPGVLYWACWRAWQTGRPVRFFTFLPILLLLETSSRAGFFCASVQSRKETRAASPGPTPK